MRTAATPIALGGVTRWLAPWRGVLGYAAFTFAVFLVALVYSLPHDLIARRAIDEATAAAPVQIELADVSFAFPNGYQLSDVRIAPREDPGLAVEIPSITLRTPLLGVLLGRFDVATFEGEAYDGRFSGSATTRSGRVTSQISVDDVDLAAAARRFLPPPGQIGGRASFDLEIAGDGRTTRSSEGKLSLQVKDLSIEKLNVRGIVVPDLRFPEVRADGGIQGVRLQVTELDASGEEVSLGARGDVLIREPPQQSVLNLQLRVEVAPNARPGLKVAMNLLPKRPPGQPATWTLAGTLASPTIR
ncbi:MAG: type II secretion system protein GspN [Deltaproteobacteria bacterium]|nr:type II secretion system protein GspN [Deltaproteobacteria bacterium]